MWDFLSRNRSLIAVALAAFVLDQLTKAVVVAQIPRGTSWPDSGLFRFTHIGNTGSAFGLFDGQNGPLIVGAIAGLAVLVYFYRSQPNPGLLIKISMGLMIAGALGNLTDRVFRDHVVDFVDVGPFWIFNVADASISVGLTVLAVSVLLFDQGPPAPEPEPEPESESEPRPALEPHDAEASHDNQPS
jgi:signal peptidase II